MDTLAVSIISLLSEAPHQMAVAPVDLWGCIIGTLILLGLIGNIVKAFRKGPLEVVIRSEVCGYHKRHPKDTHYQGCGCPKDSNRPNGPRE